MSTTTTPPFPFPREYSFPPFFTRQTNLTTHHAQLTKWAALVLSYCRHHRLFKLSLSSAISDPLTTSTSDPLSSTTTDTTATDLFHNRALNRRLSLADAREVLDFLRRDGRAEPVDGNGAGDVVWVYWRTPEEWAGLVEAWVDETAQRGGVLTLYELREGDATRGAGMYPSISHSIIPEKKERGGLTVLKSFTAWTRICCKRRWGCWSRGARRRSLGRRTRWVSSSFEGRRRAGLGSAGHGGGGRASRREVEWYYLQSTCAANMDFHMGRRAGPPKSAGLSKTGKTNAQNSLPPFPSLAAAVRGPILQDGRSPRQRITR